MTAWSKAQVERLHQTIEQTLLCGLPGYTKGPRDAAGRLHGPLSDRAADREAAGAAGAAPMRLERFVTDRFAPWATWYNTGRPHAMLDGLTPAQAWAADDTVLHRTDAAALRHLLLAGEDRTVQKNGVRHQGLCYVAPELQGRRGQKVQVRYMPHGDRSVEVYLGDAHLCTAWPQGQLTGEQVTAFREHARAEAKRLSAARRQAGRRAREELAPLTAGQAAEQPSRLVPAAAGAAAGRRGDDGALRKLASASLLGLAEPYALPPGQSYPPPPAGSGS